VKVINIRNVHEALPSALQLLDFYGERRQSRNGPVIVLSNPVTTVYNYPLERVIFWPTRDANPFFHLYESIYMLQGRNTVAPLVRYAKNVANYSDNGEVFHGAYGYRWRNQWVDQIAVIIKRLKNNPDDRRCILQMWSASEDLDNPSLDVPCNTMATFQRGLNGELNLVVFCRSNDIVWGAYGANAVQFSTLLEYIALGIGCPVGSYTQVSINFHSYINTFQQCRSIRPDRLKWIDNPYVERKVHVTPMTNFDDLDQRINCVMSYVDAGCPEGTDLPNDEWARMVCCVLKAHEVYRRNTGAERYELALEVLAEGDQKNDWIVSAREWIERRQNKFLETKVDPTLGYTV
jgi:thymidylate synthase